METILVISPHDIMPPVTGGYVRTYNVIRHLSRRYRVVLLHGRYSYYRASSAHIAAGRLENVRLIPAGAPHRLTQLLNMALIRQGYRIIKRARPKVILNELIWSGTATLWLHLLTGIPYILDQQNAEFLRIGRTMPGAARLVKQWEMILCRRAQSVLCVSEVDRRAFVRAGVDARKLLIVPNGVDPAQCRRDGEARAAARGRWGWREPVILFFGALHYPPNREAIDIIDREIAPRVLRGLPEARFVVVGPSPPPRWRDCRLSFTGAVERIEDYINASDVVICPLRSGGGTRIKILEAIACGKPVVSTSLGAEGLIGKETEPHLIVRDDWEAFSKTVAETARANPFPEPSAAFLARYSWARIVEPLIQQIDALPPNVRGG